MSGEPVDRLPTSNRMVLVAIGDLAAIGSFVAAGELSHGSPVLAGTGTFLSFAAGWIVAAIAVGSFRDDAVRTLAGAARSAAVAWLPAVLIGHVVRVFVVPGANLAPTFVLVSLFVGAAAVLVWRLFVALVFG